MPKLPPDRVVLDQFLGLNQPLIEADTSELGADEFIEKNWSTFSKISTTFRMFTLHFRESSRMEEAAFAPVANKE